MTGIANPPHVPFTNLSACHDEVRAELEDVWHDVVRTGRFIGGDVVERFESEFAEYCGVRECVGVANGTDALELALTALGISRGDEVIVPANGFVATPAAAVRVGATPVFADVDPETLLVTPETIAAVATPATAAVIVVHLYGQMPDMDATIETARRLGIAVIEDAAQAHGASWRGRRAGSFGRAAAFSLYPTKPLGAFGDGGAIVTSDPTLAATVRQLANHGRRPTAHHHHEVVGRNSRLDALQAGVLSVKLRRLERWNENRRRIASWYRAALEGTPCELVAVRDGALPVHHLEVVRLTHRESARAALAANGIQSGLHYPVPCHQQFAFAPFARDPLPVTERAASQVLSLPMFPSLDKERVVRVCEVLVAATDGVHDQARRPSVKRSGAVSGDETERAGVNAGGTGGVVPASTPLVSSGDGQTTRAAEFAVVETDRRRAALTPRLAVRLALVAIGFVVAGALGGFVVGASRQTVHGARVELMYKLREDRPAGFLRQDRQLTTQLVLIESRAVLLPVAEDAGMSFERLKRKVEASVVGDSEVLRIQVNDPSEDGARSLTQAVADRYLQIARDDPDLQERVLLERWLAELDQRRAQLEREAAEQERSRVSSTPAGSAPRPASAREAEVASELDSLLAERRDLIARHAALGVDAPEVKQVTDAYVLADPVAPKPLLTAAAGGAAALPIGLLLAAYLLRRRSIALTS